MNAYDLGFSNDYANVMLLHDSTGRLVARESYICHDWPLSWFRTRKSRLLDSAENELAIFGRFGLVGKRKILMPEGKTALVKRVWRFYWRDSEAPELGEWAIIVEGVRNVFDGVEIRTPSGYVRGAIRVQRPKRDRYSWDDYGCKIDTASPLDGLVLAFAALLWRPYVSFMASSPAE